VLLLYFVAAVVAAAPILTRVRTPQFFRFFDSAPTQVIEHFVGDSQEKGVVRLANEIQHRLPISSAFIRGVLVADLPFLEDVLHLFIGQEVVEAVRNGFNEFLFLLEKGADIRGGHLSGVVDVDRAHQLVLPYDVCAQFPRRLLEALGLAFFAFHGDLG